MQSSAWYAAYVRPRHEKKAVQHLAARQVESYLAVYSTAHRWRNRTTAKLEMPLFPGYVFVRIGPSEKSIVLGSPSVLNLVGTAGRPTPIPDAELDTIRACSSQMSAEPHPFIKVGQLVRVHRGPLTGSQGLLVRKKDKFRFVLSVDMILRSISVEIDASDITPV